MKTNKYSTIKNLVKIQQKSNASSIRGNTLPVERLQDNPDSSNIIKELYIWNPVPKKGSKIGHYELKLRNRIAKTKINDTRLRKVILSRKKETLVKFLNGRWEKEGTTNQGTYLYFAYKNKQGTLDFFIKDLLNSGESYMENFIFAKAHRLLSNQIRWDGINEIHDFRTIRVKITLQDMDKIKVDVYDNDSPWAKLIINPYRSGIYSRINESSQTDNENKKTSLPQISGLYKQSPGNQYLFDYPSIKIINSKGKITEGGYALYQSDVPIMEILIFDELNRISESRSYKFNFQESKTDKKIFRTITLYPGKITVKGFKENSRDPLILEYTEFSVEE